jgi:hypothetical protein
MAEQDWEKRFAALEARLARLEQALAPPSVPRNGEEAFPTISDSAIDEIFEVRPVAGGPVAETPRPRDELGELVPLAEIASPIESAEAARASDPDREETPGPQPGPVPPPLPSSAPPATMETAHGVLERLASRKAAVRPPDLRLAYAAPAAKEKSSASSWERTLGLKWTAWLGALVFVIGAALGLKFAYDQGWLGHVPPWGRLVIWATGSLALIGAGEWALRKVGRLASVGLFGAGVASLFLVAYTGHAYYHLYAPGTAFALMAAAAVIGAVVSARADLVSIAVVSVLGAHLAPVIIGGDGGLWRLIAYLVTLQAVSLILAGRSIGARWWTLRGLSLGAAAFWATALSLREGHVPAEAVAYSIITTLLAQLELAISSARGRVRALNPNIILYSVLATLFPFAVLWLRPDVDELRFLYATLGGWAALGLAARLLRFTALRHRDPGGALCRSFLALDDAYRLQAITLLAVGLQMKFSLDRLVWPSASAAVALAAYAAFRPVDPLSRRHYTRFFPPLLLIGPTLSLALRMADGITAHAANVPFMGTTFAPHALTGLSMAGIIQVAAFLLARPREDEPKLGLHIGTSAFGSLAFAFFAALGATPFVATLLLLTCTWLWAGVTLARPLWTARLAPTAHAVLALVAAVLEWLFLVALAPRLDPHFNPASEAFLLNGTAASGVACVLSIVLLPRVFKRWAPGIPVSTFIASGRSLLPLGIGLSMTFLGGWVELDRLVARAGEGGSRLAFGFQSDPARAMLTSAWAAGCLACWCIVTSRRRDHFRILARSSYLIIPPAFLTVLSAISAVASGPEVTPLANLAFACSLCIAAVAGFAAWATRRPAEPTSASPTAGLTTFFLLYAGLGVEVLRYCQNSQLSLGFGTLLATSMVCTLYSAGAFAALLLVARNVVCDWWGARAYSSVAVGGAFAVAGKCVLVDLLLPWLFGSWEQGFPVANLQSATAAGAFGAMAAVLYFVRTPTTRKAAAVMTGLMLFIASSIDVARTLLAANRRFGLTADPGLLITAGYSVWWAVFAFASIGAGFRVRSTPLRYTGLILFGVTLLKVGFIDLAGAGQGWRILSLLGLSGLLIATSVVYGKLAPLLLGGETSTSTDTLPDPTLDSPRSP